MKENNFKEIWNNIHEVTIPMFHWSHYPCIKYWYNEKNNTIESDCGVLVNIDLDKKNITEEYVETKIEELDIKIQNMFWDTYKIIINDD